MESRKWVVVVVHVAVIDGGSDRRWVFGAKCSWSGSVYEMGLTAPKVMEVMEGLTVTVSPMPCCPHCGGPLFELSSKEEWDDAMADFEVTHRGYSAFQAWLEQQEGCLRGSRQAFGAYVGATGMSVENVQDLFGGSGEADFSV